jgi:hypothetical protein
MDLRFMAIVMAFAIIMDILGRMMRKRAQDQQPQEPQAEGWDVMQALAEVEELPDKLLREALPVARTRPEHVSESDPEPVARVDLPGPAPEKPRFDFSPWPEPIELEPASGRAAPDLPASEPTRIEPPPVPDRPWAEPGQWESPLRDRSARPIEVRSRAPRTVERESRPERSMLEIERTPHQGVDSAPSRRGRTSDVADRLGLTNAEGLRRIVIAREVLGPPLALRDDRGTGGPGS